MASFTLKLHMNTLPASALLMMIFNKRTSLPFVERRHIHGADVPPLRFQVSVAPLPRSPCQPYRAGICHKKFSGRHPNPIRVNTRCTKTGIKIHEHAAFKESLWMETDWKKATPSTFWRPIKTFWVVCSEQVVRVGNEENGHLVFFTNQKVFIQAPHKAS